MGYILFGLVGLVVLALIAGAVIRSSGRRPTAPRPTESGHIIRDRPSADEPTPGRSAVAPAPQVNEAEKKTPPA